MQQNRGSPGSCQRFKKRISKNPKKKINNKNREEEDEEGKTGSRRDDEENLTDIE